MAKITSYNCNSVRCNSEIVKSLLLDADILFLQELMLEKRDIGFLNDFSDNFRHIAYVTDRESTGICEGRPSKGVAIFWRKCLSSFVSPIVISDSLIGVLVQTRQFKVLLLNVYLPCDMQTADAFEDYKCSLANIGAVVREYNVSQVVMAGDFNADPRKGRFWKVLVDFTKSLSLNIVTELFPCDTFTYLCPSKNSTSWLDHIVCSEGMKDKISNVSVNYETALYDHFPFSFFLEVIFDIPYDNSKNTFLRQFVNWNKIRASDKLTIANFIDDEIGKLQHSDHDVFMCCNMKCDNSKHKAVLNEKSIDI